MHTLGIDIYGSLRLKYQKNEDSQVESENQDWLIEAGYERDGEDYVVSKNNSSNFRNVIKWTKKKFSGTLVVEEKAEVIDIQANNLLESYEVARQIGFEIKNKEHNEIELPTSFKRELKPYQKKSVEHILGVENAANFSVPGAGKTTITYAAISKWLAEGIIEKILVIGPTSSFVPWEEEYQGCFEKPVRSKRLRGRIVEDFANIGHGYDLFLMHFSTAMNKILEIREFLHKFKTVLIIDESHNIKSPQLKRWASSAIEISDAATRRIILSGTPIPNSPKDLWTQITFLWPGVYPLGYQVPFNERISRTGTLSKSDKDKLQPLFCRITKTDLDLPKPQTIPYEVELRPKQRVIYDRIAAKTLEEINSFKQQSKLQKFRAAKMIRLLLTASNPTMLKEHSSVFNVESDEFGFSSEPIDKSEIADMDIYDLISNYSVKGEIPSKIVKAGAIAHDLLKKGEKVIIWCTFKDNLRVFENEIFAGENPIIISGDVPKDPPPGYAGTTSPRDDLINEFKNSKDARVLIATPSTLSEAVSLHKNILEKRVCSHAIYLDRNFNGAQFMQSMDRIHRIGMIEGDKIPNVTYHIIIAKNTIDEKIRDRLDQKIKQMHRILESPDLVEFDYDESVVDSTGEEFENDYKSLVEHLKTLHKERENEA